MSDAAIQAIVGALPAGEEPVEVLGDGPLARALRARLRLEATVLAPDARPAVIVETTGDAAAIGAALARVADLGTVVLAGTCGAGSAPVALDLYADLHVRGLTVVGVPLPGEESDPS